MSYTDFETWKNQLRTSFKITMYGCDDDKMYDKASKEFDEAIDYALKSDSPNYAIEIMKLFCDNEDYGTLESCFRVLSNMSPKVIAKAFKVHGTELKKQSNFWYSEIKDLLKDF